MGGWVGGWVVSSCFFFRPTDSGTHPPTHQTNTYDSAFEPPLFPFPTHPPTYLQPPTRQAFQRLGGENRVLFRIAHNQLDEGTG